MGKAAGGLNQFDRDTETFRRYEHDPDDPTSLSPGAVWDILEDRQGTFWVATDGGLNRMDRQTETFTRFLVDEDSLLSPYNKTRALLEDRHGRLLGAQPIRPSGGHLHGVSSIPGPHRAHSG